MGRLRDQLIREAEADNRETVRELVSNSADGSQPRRSGFAQACSELRSAEFAQLEESAIRELKGHHLSTPTEIRSFRERYLTLGRTRVDEIINEYDPDGRR